MLEDILTRLTGPWTACLQAPLSGTNGKIEELFEVNLAGSRRKLHTPRNAEQDLKDDPHSTRLVADL